MFPLDPSRYFQRVVSFIFGDSRSYQVDNISHHKSHELIVLVEDISRQHNLKVVTLLLFTGSHINCNRRNI